MKVQGPGYRDFDRWTGLAYGRALCCCEAWILDAAERPFSIQIGAKTVQYSLRNPKAPPQPPVLFRPVWRSSIPTYLVIEPEVQAWVEIDVGVGNAGSRTLPARASAPQPKNQPTGG